MLYALGMLDISVVDLQSIQNPPYSTCEDELGISEGWILVSESMCYVYLVYVGYISCRSTVDSKSPILYL